MMPDPLAPLIPPLVPDRAPSFRAAPAFTRALERHVQVGPLSVSAARCPSCGELYASIAPLRADEPDPDCPRCTFDTVPHALAHALTPDVRDAMRSARVAYQAYLDAQGMSGATSQVMHATSVRASNEFWIVGPTLLAALEQLVGDQTLRPTHDAPIPV